MSKLEYTLIDFCQKLEKEGLRTQLILKWYKDALRQCLEGKLDDGLRERIEAALKEDE